MCALTPTIEADRHRIHPSGPVIEVAVAVISDGQGRYLLSQRHPAAHQGGRWEFPGGKLEPGETSGMALERELVEELGIRPTRYDCLIVIPFSYPEYRVRLHVYHVNAFAGSPRGCEGQRLGWFSSSELSGVRLPDANRGILTALRLPERHLITPEPDHDSDFIAKLESTLEAGVRLVQLRAKTVTDSRLKRLAEAAVAVCHDYGGYLILNGPVEMARAVGADGVHLTTAALAQMRPGSRPQKLWLSASCHNVDELARAAALDVDFALCSPVRPTASHPHAHAMGWQGFAELVALAPFPVYALGGMRVADIEQARQCGGQGVAAIGGLWARSLRP